jgi:hypothetical protein
VLSRNWGVKRMVYRRSIRSAHHRPGNESFASPEAPAALRRFLGLFTGAA